MQLRYACAKNVVQCGDRSVVLEFEPSVPDFSYKCKIERSKEQHVHPCVHHHEEDKLCDTESHENQNALPYGCIDFVRG